MAKQYRNRPWDGFRKGNGSRMIMSGRPEKNAAYDASATKQDVKHALEEFINVLTTNPCVLDDFSAVRSFLLPKLYVRCEPVNSAEGIPSFPIAEHLVARVVWDQPSSVVQVADSQLAQWNVSFEEAYQVALDNLKARLQNHPVKRHEGIYIYEGDHYAASQLLIQDLSEWQVDGDLLAFAPGSDLLIVTGSNNRSGLEEMLLTAKHLSGTSHLATFIPLRRERAMWTQYQPPIDHPLHNQFHELFLAERSELYHAQRLTIDETTLTYASHYLVFQRGDTSQLCSVSVWNRSLDHNILPQTEYVSFLSLDETLSHPTIHVGGAPWDSVMATVGHRMVLVDECYPPRYLTKSFPDDQELERLAAKDVFDTDKNQEMQ